MSADDAYSAGPEASPGEPARRRGHLRPWLPPLRRRAAGAARRLPCALFWHSLRSSFGIGRGAKAKILPVIAFVAICLPAVVNAVAVAKGGAPVVFYGTYTFPLRVVVMTIFVAVAGARARLRATCAVTSCRCTSPGRCAGGTIRPRSTQRSPWPASLMIEIPLLLLYLGNIVSAQGGSGVWHQTRLLAGGLGVGALWAVLLAAIGLALACLTAKRAYATGAVAIFFFLTWTLAQIIYSVAGHPVVVHPAAGHPLPPAWPRLRPRASPRASGWPA